MGVSLTSEPGAGGVQLTGVVTVSSAVEVMTALTEALAPGHPVVVDIQTLERADMSLLQLLIAAANVARDIRAEFTIDGDPAPLLKAAGGSPDILGLLGI